MYRNYVLSGTPLINSKMIPFPIDDLVKGDIILSYMSSEGYTSEYEQIMLDGYSPKYTEYPKIGSFLENKIIEISNINYLNLDCLCINLNLNNNNGESITYLPLNTKIYTNHSWSDIISEIPISIGDAYLNWKSRWKVICEIQKTKPINQPKLYEIITEKDNIVLESFIIKSQ